MHVAPWSAVTHNLPHLSGLNSEQLEAVRHGEGPLLVIAGAGSGKTRVLTCRIAHLIYAHGVLPEQILALTFTNKAAGEVKERVARLIGRDPRGMWVGTFHGFGAHILRENAERIGWTSRFSIFDADDSLRVVRNVIDRAGLSRKDCSPHVARQEISAAKNRLETPAHFLERAKNGKRPAFQRTLAAIYEAYDADLKRQNAFDFDDLIVRSVALLRREPDVLAYYADRYRYILVDEYQDTNVAQYQLLSLLAGNHRNIMAVGDPDQAIYGWRQADVRNILEFEKDFPGAHVVRLEQNYRSTGRILETANHVIRFNKDRKEKNLWTNNPEGEPVRVVSLNSDREEAAWIAEEVHKAVAIEGTREYRDFAVLYRTNAQSRLLEEAFRQRRIPHQVVGGFSFYERREVRDALAYLRLLANPADEAAFERVVNYPRRGIGPKSMDLVVLQAKQDGITVLEAARRAAHIEGLTRGARAGLREFAALIDRFRALVPQLTVGDLLRGLLEETQFLNALAAEGQEGEERIDNIRELMRSADEFSSRDGSRGTAVLERFLQEVTLSTDADEADENQGGVILTSLHSAKGLEYPVVFLSGLEEGLFPHDRSLDSWETLEEERRLFYVGITRAREQLFITWAVLRRRGADLVPAQPSSFLRELPPSVITSPSTHARNVRPTMRPTARPAASAPAEIAFHAGQRVVHPALGSGIIAEVIGHGAATQLLIDFDTVGRRRMLARYSGLRPA